MNYAENIPTTLKVVAGLLIVNGLYYLITLFVTAKFDVAVFNILVGISLFALQRWAYIVGLLAVGIQIIIGALGVLLSFFTAAPTPFTPFGWYIGQVDRPFIFGYMLFWLLLALWQWQVLRRPNIRALFEQSQADQPGTSIGSQ